MLSFSAKQYIAVANNNILKRIENHKNSIFMKILTPTIAVLLLQVALISLALMLNGTVNSLDESATDSIYRNAENRSITLAKWNDTHYMEPDKNDSNACITYTRPLFLDGRPVVLLALNCRLSI